VNPLSSSSRALVWHRSLPILCLFLSWSAGGQPTASVRSAQEAHSFAVEKHGQGSPVILIPGLGCSGAVWRHTVESLQTNHECHVLTLAGFAGQPPTGSPLLDVVPKDLAKYITEQKLRQPALLGHSMGGFLSLRTAAEFPQAVGPIIIVDSLPFFGGLQQGATASNVQATAEIIGKAMANQSREQFLDYSKQALSRMVNSAADQKVALEWMSASDQKTVAVAFQGLFAADLQPELPQIRSRALVIEAGAEPGAVPEGIFKAQYQGLRGVKLIRDPHARHFVMLDDPDFFLTTVKEFLDR